MQGEITAPTAERVNAAVPIAIMMIVLMMVLSLAVAIVPALG